MTIKWTEADVAFAKAKRAIEKAHESRQADLVDYLQREIGRVAHAAETAAVVPIVETAGEKQLREGLQAAAELSAKR